jgi:hypothetical protein
MKSKKIPLGQFIFETKNLDGPTQKYLDITAPLIGYLIYSFNTLEEQLNSTLCEFINNRADEPGVLVIYKMNYASKIDFLNRFLISLQRVTEKDVPFFDAFLNDLRELGRLRNAVIHADWETADFKGYTFIKHSMGKWGMEQEYIQFSPASLRKIIRKIKKTYNDYDTFDNKYHNLLR